MTDLPFDLLVALASEQQQVAHIIGATEGTYLLPEEILNDAWHFCERATQPNALATLTGSQAEALQRLLSMLKDSGQFLDGYDRTNVAELVRQDPIWASLRCGAADVLSAFHRPSA